MPKDFSKNEITENCKEEQNCSTYKIFAAFLRNMNNACVHYHIIFLRLKVENNYFGVKLIARIKKWYKLAKAANVKQSNEV